MATVTVYKELSISTIKAWTIIRDFAHVNRWVEDVKKIWVTEMNDKLIRHLTLSDGSKVSEELLKLDDENHIISYGSLVTELPFKDYIAIIEVKPITHVTCEVIWLSTYTPQGIEEKKANELLKTNYLRYLKKVEDLAQNAH